MLLPKKKPPFIRLATRQDIPPPRIVQSLLSANPLFTPVSPENPLTHHAATMPDVSPPFRQKQPRAKCAGLDLQCRRMTHPIPPLPLTLTTVGIGDSDLPGRRVQLRNETGTGVLPIRPMNQAHACSYLNYTRFRFPCKLFIVRATLLSDLNPYCATGVLRNGD